MAPPREVFPADVRRRYEGSDAEERRLFYVALTRARDVRLPLLLRAQDEPLQALPLPHEVAGEPPLRLDRLPLPEPPRRRTSESRRRWNLLLRRRPLRGVRLPLPPRRCPRLPAGAGARAGLRQGDPPRPAPGGRDPSARLGRSRPGRGSTRLIDRAFYLPFADAPAFERMHQAANRLVSRYVDRYAADLRRIWAVERPFELHLPTASSPAAPTSSSTSEGGRIGSLAIVDYKVAADARREERYETQLQVYSRRRRGAKGLTSRPPTSTSCATAPARAVESRSTEPSGRRSFRRGRLVRRSVAGRVCPPTRDRSAVLCDYRRDIAGTTCADTRGRNSPELDGDTWRRRTPTTAR